MEQIKRKKNAVDLSTMSFGKVPPQARDLEEMVIGACLIQKGCFTNVSDILNRDCFYVLAHQIIFDAMASLQQFNEPIDQLTVVQELMKMEQIEEVGGIYAVTKLTNNVTANANTETYCRIILEKFILRKCIEIGGTLLSRAYDDSTDAIELTSEFEKEVFTISNLLHFTGYESASSLAIKNMKRVEYLRSMPDKAAITGVTSGFKILDTITFGWQPSDLIILAARPSVGKTAYSLNLAKGACENGEGVGFFSLEMGADQLTNRIISDISQVPLERITRGTMADYEWGQYIQGKSIFEKFNLQVDDTAAITIQQLRSKARQMVRKEKVKMIIIDYLQLMSVSHKSKSGNREQEVSEISRGLKQLAKELKVPIIALSQLSRGLESRKESKMPQLSDLRESGAIEQDADIVMFIYRPEYHDIKVNECGETTKGETHLKIAKHRNGILTTLFYNAVLSTQTFYEVSEEEIKKPILGPNSQGGFKKLPTTEPGKNYWDRDKDFDDETEKGY